jgi:hypothetical protein
MRSKGGKTGWKDAEEDEACGLSIEAVVDGIYER